MRAAAVVLVATVAVAVAQGAVGVPAGLAAAAPAQGRPLSWSRPVRFAGPVGLDALPTEVGVSSTGRAAIGFGFFDADKPSGAQAQLALTAADGHPGGGRAVPHSRQVLDVADFHGAWTVLAATSGGGLPCCTEVQALALSARGFTAPRVLVRGLRGVVLGRLLVAGGRQLAVFASSTGVWVAQANRSGRFGAVGRLSATGVSPQSLVASAVHGGGTLVAWTQSPLTAGDTPWAPTIVVARGAPGHLPAHPKVVQELPTGTSGGSLAMAPNPWRPTLGWAQDASDGSSEVVLADVTAQLRPRTFQSPGEAASGVTGAAAGAGDEVFAWQTCDEAPTCRVVAVSRPAGGHFGVAHPLGAADTTGGPEVAMGTGGAAVIGWVHNGHVWVSRRVSAAGHFLTPQQLPSAGAYDLRLAAAPGGHMLAVWTEGTARTTLWASVLR